jgi:hypothetical protein
MRCEIVQTDDRGGHTGNQLHVEEQAEIDAASFYEVAAVLGRFHELAETIKAEQV